MDSSLFVRRPKPTDDEDDLLELQAQFQASTTKSDRPSVHIHRVKRKGAPLTSESIDSLELDEETVAAIAPPSTVPLTKAKMFSSRHMNEGGRFTVDLENITEEYTVPVVTDIQEKNADYLGTGRKDDVLRIGKDKSNYSKEDGFPDVLDLSEYYKAGSKPSTSGKSFFAMEFDRLHGVIDETIVKEEEMEAPASSDVDFESENDRYLAKLSQEKIEEFRKEIQDRLDPKTISFLAERQKKRKLEKEDTSTNKESKVKTVSKFKQSRMAASGPEPPSVPEVVQPPPSPPAMSMDDIVKQLEVLDEFADRTDEENYNRIATDAVQLDFATKCLRNMLPRQQQNAIKLFDNLKVPLADRQNTDPLIETARSQIDKIKELYLEEVKSGDRTFVQFAHGLNPIVDGSWTLRPVRRVIDAVDKRNGEVTADDMEIVRLSLLWTLILFEERPSAFFAFVEPHDIYVRLAEIFMIGSSILEDDVIVSCMTRMMNNYVLKAASEGRLVLRLASRIADLDAFMPFFDDLVKHFEEFSLGDVQFARTLLIGTYLNAAVGDSMECRFLLWSSKKHTARQMSIQREDAADILSLINKRAEIEWKTIETDHFVQYSSLLGSYCLAIRDQVVTRERNPVMFDIAASELGRFVKRHSVKDSSLDEAKSKEFDMLVDIIRKVVKDHLSI